MKINKFLTYGLLTAVAAASLTACEDDVMLGQADISNIGVPDQVVYVTDKDGKRIYTSVDLHGTENVPLYVNTLSKLDHDCDVAFTYDATAVDQYNAVNGTSYEAVPESMISLEA